MLNIFFKFGLMIIFNHVIFYLFDLLAFIYSAFRPCLLIIRCWTHCVGHQCLKCKFEPRRLCKEFIAFVQVNNSSAVSSRLDICIKYPFLVSASKRTSLLKADLLSEHISSCILPSDLNKFSYFVNVRSFCVRLL